MGTTIHVAAYIRVSDPNLKDSDTLESQLDEIRKYCDSKGYILDEVYIYADAKTAYMEDYSKRPSLMRLLNEARKKPFQKVIVHKFARLARRQEEQTVLIYKFAEMDIDVESVCEKYEKSPVGTILRALDSYNSEIERNQIVERVNRGRRKRATMGKLLGQGYTTYGYSWGKNKESYIISDEVFYTDAGGIEWSERRVVELIFEYLKHAVSLRKIAIALTERGIPTRRGKPVWLVSTVREIATNEFYTGVAYAFKWERHGVHIQKLRPREEWVRLPDNVVPQIIDCDTFTFVQEQLERNKKNAFRRNKYPTLSILRNGHIVCGICKRVLRVMNYKQIQAGGVEVLKSYYRCDRITGLTDELHHHFVAANVLEIDSIAWNYAVSLIRCPAIVEEKVSEFRKSLLIRDDLGHIEAALSEVKRKTANLIKVCMDATDEDTIALLKATLISLEKEKHSLQVLYNDVSSEQDVYAQVQAEIDKFVSWCDKTRSVIDSVDFVPTFEEKRTAIQILGIQIKAFPTKGNYPNRYIMETNPPGIVKALTVNGLLKN